MTLGDELLAWAVTRDGMQAVTIEPVGEAALAREIGAFCEACAKGFDEALIRTKGEALAKKLLKPFDAIIDAHKHLVVVPYGELHRLPFAALLWRDNWLGATRTLSYVPSATLFARMPRPAGAPSTVLAVGAPAGMAVAGADGVPRALNPLPGTREEADFVVRLFGGKPLVAENATRAKVLGELGSHRAFHFGTHGIIDADAPLRSGIALADGERLTVQDLLGCRFDADLVTMSACETGLGPLMKGEEVVGLSRGLLAAGARCIVVSLWPVDDGVTAVLMKRFYQELKGGCSPSRALQAAQQSVRGLQRDELSTLTRDPRDAGAEAAPPERGPGHPYYWAPFIVVGVWQGE